jgi:hypothetical protein
MQVAGASVVGFPKQFVDFPGRRQCYSPRRFLKVWAVANSVAHFEIFASDVERARKFYERVFGWRFEVAGPPGLYLIVTGPKSDPGLTHGLLAKRNGAAVQGPLNGFRCTISVRSITESAAAIEAAGGKLRSRIVDIPDVGEVVEFADTENNIACVMQYKQGLPFAVQ